MKSAFGQLKAYPGRFVAVCLAIVIGVGFTVTTLVFTSSFNAALTQSVGAEYTGVDVVVTPDYDQKIETATLSQVPGVALVQPRYRSYGRFAADSSRGYVKINTVPKDQRLRWYGLRSGVWPMGSGEVAVDLSTAERNGLSLGSTLTVTGSDEIPRPVLVVAILDTSSSAIAGTGDEFYAAAELGMALTRNIPSSFDIVAAPGVSPEALVAPLQAIAGPNATVETGEAASNDVVKNIIGDSNVLAMILLTFAAIAGLVAAIVIANTFTILLAQRQRQIALTRCIGATAGQVRRTVLAEAAMIGVIGSVLGVGMGIAVGKLATALADIGSAAFTVEWIGIGIAAALGVLVTVVAAVAPARRAMRIAPIAALSPVPTSEEAKRSGRFRTITGGLLMLGGGAALVGGIMLPALAVSVLGGAVSALGILLLLRSALPFVLRRIGSLAAIAGVPGKLAATNTIRNPGRAAATCTALVIGVGLIVTLQVASASARSSTDASLAEQYPLDLSVTAIWNSGEPESSQPQAIAATLADQLDSIDGLSAVGVLGGQIDIPIGPDKTNVMAYGATGEQYQSVLNIGPMQRGALYVPSWMIADGLEVGQNVTLEGPGGTLNLSVVQSEVAGSFPNSAVVMSAEDLTMLVPDASVAAIWGQLSDVGQANEVIGEVKPLLADYPDLYVGGGAPERASIDEALSTILAVATALLAVAVVIAVVGIGNTLGLSVIERTRESALLRALGLRRGQLRLMLGVEAALLALVGTVVGVFFGVLYGWSGAAATFNQAGQTVVLSLPWAELGLVLVLALVAGVLASVLPARRAAKATPTDALAEV